MKHFLAAATLSLPVLGCSEAPETGTSPIVATSNCVNALADAENRRRIEVLVVSAASANRTVLSLGNATWSCTTDASGTVVALTPAL